MPGVNVTSGAARGSRGEPTESGAAFVADFAASGPHDEAVRVAGLDDFESTFGPRVSYSFLYDWLETFFEEGGGEAYVAREVGPTPVKASLTLEDRADPAVETLTIEALSVGDYGNDLAVQVQDGTQADTFRLIITLDGDEVERWDNLESPSHAVETLEASRYVRGVDEASESTAPDDNPAVVAATNLAGGDDDRANATQDEFDAALALFHKDLGPGQVAAPGRASQPVHQSLIAHASSRNRTAYLDTADQASKSAATSARSALADSQGAEYAGLWGSWVTIPGLSGSGSRAVPGSAFVAGQTNRIDRLEGTAAAAPAGELSTARFVTGVRLPSGGLTDDDYEELNANGINMIREFRNRGVQNYGFRSVTSDEDWTQLTANRLRVSLTAKLDARAQRFPFRRIDGGGKVFSDFNGELAGVCLGEYRVDALFGATPEEAFRVDTGETVNTEQTAADGEINGQVFAKFAPFAEMVNVGLFKVPVTSRV